MPPPPRSMAAVWGTRPAWAGDQTFRNCPASEVWTQRELACVPRASVARPLRPLLLSRTRGVSLAAVSAALDWVVPGAPASSQIGQAPAHGPQLPVPRPTRDCEPRAVRCLEQFFGARLQE